MPASPSALRPLNGWCFAGGCCCGSGHVCPGQESRTARGLLGWRLMRREMEGAGKTLLLAIPDAVLALSSSRMYPFKPASG